MLPLNDEWLSWPPESLDSFFTGCSKNRLVNDFRPEEQAPVKQSQQEQSHETAK